VSEADRAQTHAVFNKFISVRIPDVASLAALDKSRRVQGELIFALCIDVRSAGIRAQARSCSASDLRNFVVWQIDSGIAETTPLRLCFRWLSHRCVCVVRRSVVHRDDFLWNMGQIGAA